MKEISLKELLEVGAHFGHQTVRWNPKMRSYIFAARGGVHIFDLAKTKDELEKAMAFVEETAASGGKILFLGTKRQAAEVIKEVAQKVGMPYVSERWLGGTITNFEQIKKSLDKMKKMKEERAADAYKDYTKKEQLLIDRQIAKLEKFFGGIASLEKLPEAIFVVDVKKEEAAILEAKRREIKIVAVVDTNSNPDMVDYVIPANDDAPHAVELIVRTIGEAVEAGLKKLNKRKPKKNETSQNNHRAS